MSKQLDIKFANGGDIIISEILGTDNVMSVTTDLDYNITVVYYTRSESLAIARYLIQQFGFTEEELRNGNN